MAGADRQNFTRIAANVEAKMVSWIAAMLTDQISMPTDGLKITADNDAAGKSPVNVGLKDLANMLTGLAGSIYGNIVGVTQRSMKSLYVDGTGGVIHTASSGTIVPSAARGGVALPTTANPHGVISADSPIFGFASFSWNGAAYVFTGGFNVDSIANPAVGTAVVTFASAPANYLKCACVGGGFFNSGANFVSEAIAGVPGGGKMPVTVYIKNLAGVAADAGFSLIVFCGAGA